MIVKMWGVRGMKLLTFLFWSVQVSSLWNRERNGCKDTVYSRLTDTLLLQALRVYEQQLNPSPLRTFVYYQVH